MDEDRIAFWQTDNRVKQHFEFNAVLKSAFPVKDVRVPGFQNNAVISKRPSDTESAQSDIYDISLSYPEGSTLSKDIVLYYRLDDNTPARVELIPFKEPGAADGKFMLVITPGSDLSPIQNGSDWTFVLDVSGSMEGNKITTLVEGVRKTIKQLTPDHRFRIITFNEKAHEITNGFINATQVNMDQAFELLNSIRAGGSTNLYEGLETAYKGLDADRTSGIIVVTDGVANVGPSKHAQLMALHRKYDFRLFTFIIGNSANQPLLEALAKESGGFALNVSSSDDVIGRILQAKIKMTHESLYNTKVNIRGERTTDITPSTFGNLYMGQQIVLFGNYTSPGKVSVELTGTINGQDKKWTTQALLPDQDTDNPEIERLWAFASIEEIMENIRQNGETSSLVNKIVDLGTGYSLVTDYTSMAVLDDEEMENQGLTRKNATRVQKERSAQSKRAQAPVNNYRTATKDGSGMFGHQTSPGIGTGAVGPLFIGLVCFIRRKFRKQ